mmetsp:Transcript_44133/g.89080  ORF Transcript_44133/g.89080 Transcript_44133/m.89080 type:complete len:424 (-) Transcript_44133:412-1683(-)
MMIDMHARTWLPALPGAVWLSWRPLVASLEFVFQLRQLECRWECIAAIILLLVAVLAACVSLARCSGSGSRPAHPGIVETDAKVVGTPVCAATAEVKIMDMQTGRMTRSNPSSPMCFDTEIASGSYLLKHRRWPSEEDSSEGDQGGVDDADEYFRGKKRLWEVRFQCTFKVRVAASSLRIGSSPFQRMPVGGKQVAAQRWLTTFMSNGLRGMYNSPGDDPSGRHPDDVEPPVTSVPLTEVDQYVPPPEGGGAAPDLLDPSFPSHGIIKATDSAAMKKHLRNAVFEPGEIHTFAFWAPSRAFDLARWRIAKNVPFAGGSSLDALNGPPPMFLSIYLLKPGQGRERRHLKSRVTMVWQVAGWSSKFPPTPERMKRLREMATGSTAITESKGQGVPPPDAPKPTQCHSFLMPCGMGIHRFIRGCLV